MTNVRANAEELKPVIKTEPLSSSQVPTLPRVFSSLVYFYSQVKPEDVIIEDVASEEDAMEVEEETTIKEESDDGVSLAVEAKRVARYSVICA